MTVQNRVINFADTRIAFSSKSNLELRKSYLLFNSMDYPWLVKLGTSLISTSFKLGLPIKGIVKNTLFNQFCGGESIQDCENTIQKLGKFHIGTILDYSVEGKKSDESFDFTTEEIIRTIVKASQEPNIPFSVFKVTGICAIPILEKLQAGTPLNTQENTEWEKAQQRVLKICETAHHHKVRIFIDAEETWIQAVIDELAFRMMEKFNQKEAIVYNTYQMYLHAKLAQLKTDLDTAATKGYKLGVKLVRGAYMEKESERASTMGYENPIQPSKDACDQDYNAALRFLVENSQYMALCAGTHNEDSSLYLTQLMAQHNISAQHPNFFFAQLYGMSDHISYNLANATYNVAKYVPYGPVKEVMPYLFRRAEENTSIAGQSSRELLLVREEMKRRQQL
ncbi:proline dehydrogenase family protein [Algivirga pacifica]|uniref:Proline dehydrogenase family protein n=1 Tax=Algivirga pacifica TaxID=1162670 RepID=A0ABP9DA04_9BACT